MEVKNVVYYSFSLNGEDPIAHLRIIGPLSQTGINIINGMENGQPVNQRVSDGDIVIIQRDFPKRFNDYQKIVKNTKREGKPLVFDLDDLLFFLPVNHPDRQSQYYASSLLPMYQALKQADLVTVATPKLQRVLANYNDHITVLPNYFDDNLWHFRQPVLQAKSKILTIGYMGGNSHEPDLELVVPILSELIKRYPNKICLKFWGIKPPEKMRFLPQVAWIPLHSYIYREFSEFFQTQSADIFIAPLVDSLFNRCKSPLKFFEYTALGTPGVYSNLDTYSDVVSHGQNGLLAASLDEWNECLTQLIEDGDLRLHLGNNAQASIRAKWLLSQNAFRWHDAYQSLSGITPRQTRSQDRVIQSVNEQLLEMFVKKDMETQAETTQEESLRGHIAEQDAQVQSLRGRIAEQDAQVQTLRGQIAERDAQVQSLRGHIAEQDTQVQTLSSTMTEREYTIQKQNRKIEEIRAQLREITTSKAWRAVLLLKHARVWLIPHGSHRAHFLRGLFSPFSYLLKIRQDQLIKKELSLIRKSFLWDEAWYLANNHDVALTKIDPVIHYLLFGGFESRDPGPSFSSKQYLDMYSDVKETGINPLIHYLKYGKKEGRVAFSAAKGAAPKSKTVENNKQKRESLTRIIIDNTQIGFYNFYRRLPLGGKFRQKLQRFAYKVFPTVSNYKKTVNQIMSKRHSGFRISRYNGKYSLGENSPLVEKHQSDLALFSSLVGMDESSLESLLVSHPWKIEDLESPIDKHIQTEQAVEKALSPVLFTIILVVNDPPAHFLNDCITSIQKQNFKNWQIKIYVKEDGLWNVDVLAEQLADRDPRIHIKSTNFNPDSIGELKESVLDSAGEYIIFLNSNDVLNGDVLENVASEIATSGYDLIYCPNDFSSTLSNKCISKDQNQLDGRSFGDLAFSQFVVWKKTYLQSLLPDSFGSFSEGLCHIRNEFISIGKPKLVKTLESPCCGFRQIPGRIHIIITGTVGNLDLEVSSIPLRILIDARLINRQLTGTERYILELLKALSLLCNEYNLDLKAIASSQPKEKIDGVDLITTNHIEAIRNSHVFHKTFPASDGRTLAEMALAPSVVFSPLDMILYSSSDYFLNETNFYNYRTIMQLAADLSDRIISISNHGKLDIERLLHIPEKMISTVYLGVNPERFSLDKQEARDKLTHLSVPSNYFLFIGTDYPHKNLVKLLLAFQIARKQIPETHLVLVGTNYYLRSQPKLNELMKKMARHIVQIGHVPDNILPALYHNAIGLVYPSLYEGFGLPIVEAMLCGTPVIASDNTSIPEVSGEAAILVNGRDEKQIAVAMLKVWDDPELRSRMVLAGYKNAAKFNWESTARQTIKCYQEAIKKEIFTSTKKGINEKFKILNGLRIPPSTILIVTHLRFYPPSAGNEQRLFRLVKYLKRLGYRIIMLVNPFMETTQLDRDSRSILHQYVDYYEEIGDIPIEEPYTVPLDSEIGNEPILERWKSYEESFCSSAVIDRVQHLMEEFSPKIMLAEYIWISRIFALARPGILKVIDAHDMFSQKDEKVTKFGIQDTLAITSVEELAFINRSDVVIAIQKIEEEAFRKLAPSCRIITAGVDFDVDQLPEDTSPDTQYPILLIVGSGNQINVTCVNEFLDQTWPAIKQRIPLCKLRIVGKICDLLKTNDRNVELIPYSSDLDSIYKSASVVINPVYPGTGLKVKSVEALGHGKALICWPEGAIGIPTEDPAPFKIIHNWEEMEESVINLVNDHHKRRDLEKVAQEYAKSKLSAKAVYQQIADCFDIFCGRELNVLCLFLRYGTKDYPESMVDLQNWYEKKMPGTKVTIWIIDNKIKNEFEGFDLKTGFRLFSGNNTEREFSAFQKILTEHRDEIGSYDIIHFVTSAFNSLFTNYLDYFSKGLLESVTHRSLCLGHIDAYDEPILIENETSQSWIRTCFFFMSSETVRAIPAFVSFREESQFFDVAGNFLSQSSLSENYKKYISDWLCGETMQGVPWHNRILDPAEFKAKALAILNEHMLSIRLRKAGVDLVDIYWAKMNCKELNASFDYSIPDSMEQVKVRQAGLFGTIPK